MNKIRNLYNDHHAMSFLLCMLIFGIAIGLQSGVLNNYLYEVLSISRLERGIMEFPRELPGLLLFVIIAFLSRFSERKGQEGMAMGGVGSLGHIGQTIGQYTIAIVFFALGVLPGLFNSKNLL